MIRYNRLTDGVIYLVVMYAKGVKDSIPAKTLNMIRKTIKTRCTVSRSPRWLWETAIGFSRTLYKGAKASAALYSIVSTARANGLEPYAYLRRLFAELPKAKTVADFEAMLPLNIAPT